MYNLLDRYESAAVMSTYIYIYIKCEKVKYDICHNTNTPSNTDPVANDLHKHINRYFCKNKEVMEKKNDKCLSWKQLLDIQSNFKIQVVERRPFSVGQCTDLIQIVRFVCVCQSRRLSKFYPRIMPKYLEACISVYTNLFNINYYYN